MAENQLYVVATPIGNLADITVRAQQVLESVDIIAAEDTRHTKKLLNHLGIQKPLMATHDHNEAQAAQQIIEKLQAGQNVAIVSDAGTPLIADPGYHVAEQVAKAAIEQGMRNELHYKDIYQDAKTKVLAYAESVSFTRLEDK